MLKMTAKGVHCTKYERYNVTLYSALQKIRENLDELLDTFSDSEIKVIETYLVKTIEIIDEKTNSISKN